MRELMFTSITAGCCGVHLNISAKRPSPNVEMGVTIACVRDKEEVIVRNLVEGGVLHAAGLKQGDRCVGWPRAAGLELRSLAFFRSEVFFSPRGLRHPTCSPEFAHHNLLTRICPPEARRFEI